MIKSFVYCIKTHLITKGEMSLFLFVSKCTYFHFETGRLGCWSILADICRGIISISLSQQHQSKWTQYSLLCKCIDSSIIQRKKTSAVLITKSKSSNVKWPPHHHHFEKCTYQKYCLIIGPVLWWYSAVYFFPLMRLCCQRFIVRSQCVNKQCVVD